MRDPGSVRDRWSGYNVRIYTSEAWLSRYYDKAWFRSVLDTIRLHPEDAARPSPSA